jgi:spore germination protein KB
VHYESSKISKGELIYLIGAFIQGSVIFISFIGNLTKHDTWLAVLAGFIITFPIIAIYIELGKKFAGRNLIAILEITFGTFLGKVVSILYLCFFWLLLVFNLKGLGNFLLIFMPETPMAFFIVIFVIVCAYTLTVGIEVLARLSFLFVVVALLIICSTFLFLLKDMNFSNFLPIFVVPWQDFLHGIHVVTVMPFGEIVVFLMVLPYINNINSVAKSTTIGFILGGISFLIIAIRNTAILGSTEFIWSSPSLQATRLINIGNILTRMDILIATGHTILLFVKCSILYHAVVVSFSQLLRLRTYLPVIIPVGGISVTLSMIVYESTIDHNISAQNTWPIVATLFVVVFPSILLLTAAMRNQPKRDVPPKNVLSNDQTIK